MDYLFYLTAMTRCDLLHRWALSKATRKLKHEVANAIPKYNKAAILKFHSLAFDTSVQNEQRDIFNIIGILELPLDYAH